MRGRNRGRRLPRSGLAIATLAVLLAATPAAPAAPLTPPSAFELEASNGYSMSVFGSERSTEGPATVLVVLYKRGAVVLYVAPATVTSTSLEADLGDVGEMAVSFHPTGAVRRQRSRCGPGGAEFQDGFYEGTIRFEGEEGYARVTATRARGSLQFLLGLFCGSSGGAIGSGLPGAELEVQPRRSSLGPSFSANKNHPAGRALFGAGISERHGQVEINRAVDVRGRPGSFVYAPSLASATLAPPAPFSGSATFDRVASGARRWRGTLSVDFPGRSDVPLTGPARRVRLVHARFERQLRRPLAATAGALGLRPMIGARWP